MTVLLTQRLHENLIKLISTHHRSHLQTYRLMLIQDRQSGLVQNDTALDTYTIKHRSRSGTRAIGGAIRRRIIKEVGLMRIFLFGELDGCSISFT